MEINPEEDDGKGVKRVKKKLSDLDLSFKNFTKIFLSLREITFSENKYALDFLG